MRATPASGPGKLVFECSGGTNMESEKDGHMHHAEITVLGDDRIRAIWTHYKNGSSDHTSTFELTRKVD